MNAKTLLRFDELPEDALMLVGGKGANLATMWRSSFPVPDGFCLTSTAFEWFVEENRPVVGPSVGPSAGQSSSAQQLHGQDWAELRAALANGRFPLRLREEILEAYQGLIDASPETDCRVAVRSSATAEDLPQASFAGQQETFLNIRTPQRLLEAIKACYASLYGDRAVSYRHEAGFDDIPLSMAVVVQRMVEADVAGVIFTVDPLSQDEGLMMVNASWGLGESIVSGHVTPDSWLCDRKTGAIISQTLGSKETMVIYGDTGESANGDEGADGDEDPGESAAAETKTVPVPSARRDEFCLDDSTLKDLIALAARIENHYGCPQDIEWALADGRLFVLQSRAITTLGGNERAAGGSYSDGIDAAGASARASARAAHPDDTRSPQSRTRTHGHRSSKLNAAAERAMMNNLIEHCPEPLYPLEFVPLKIMEAAKANVFATLGIVVGDEFDFDEDGRLLPTLQRVRINPNILRLPGTVKRLLDFTDNQEKTLTEFSAVRANLQTMEDAETSNMTEQRLLENLSALLEASQTVAHIRFRHNIFPFVILSKLLGGRLNRIRKGLTEYDLLVDLPYFTVRMNERLAELAATQTRAADERAKEDARNAKVEVETGTRTEGAAQLRFQQEYDAFLCDFGWKSTASFLPFGSTSFNEDPATLTRLLAVSQRARSAEMPTGRYANITQRIENTFRPKVAQRLREHIEQLRTYHVNREESLYLLETCYGLMRRFARELEARNPSIFSRQGDIRFLMMEELLDRIWLKDPDACRMLIERRREGRVDNSALWSEMEISAKTDEAGVLKGTSGNRGTAKGRARVIQSLNEFSLMQAGEVLVCRYTDPAWTPLFSLAAAVVSDTGGPLSHSAIVAREYGIPAVLGCGNATQTIHTDDLLLVDGTNGTVHLL
jgi:pyruvate,water dikinase